jgi:asparagine synthase (glutamine-hydrolysing)
VRDLGYKVVLTGEGADEILGGYDIYKETKIRRFWAADPDSRVRPILLKRLYPYLSNIQAQPIDYLKAAFQIGEEDLSNLFFSHLPRWRTTAQSKVFFSDDVKSQLGGYSCYKELEQTLPAGYRAWDDFCRAQYLETKYLLPGYILSSQGDRVAMGHSVEGRFPFLDYRLVEFCNTIPPRLKMKVLNEKYILKRAAGHLVPLSVRQRAKRPYRAPEAASFFDSAKGAARQEYVDDLLSERTVAEFGVFSPMSVRKLVEKAKGGRLIGIKDNMALTGIISTQLFLKQFMTSAYAAGVANADFGT